MNDKNCIINEKDIYIKKINNTKYGLYKYNEHILYNN